MSNLHPLHPTTARSAVISTVTLPFDPAQPAGLRRQTLTEALPAPLRAALDSGRIERHSRFTDDGFAGLDEMWTPPDGITPRDAELARRVLDDLEADILAPAAPNHLLGRILALLSHYPAKATSPEVEQLLAMDWADDLGEFPSWAIDQAARVWRRTRKWRPSIAEMRALCEEACASERALADRLRAIVRAGRPVGALAEPSPVRDFTGALRRMPG
ncbi:hypothetical protein [Azospirillum griseum]|uniref:hypothetical protein n=1 Tax=Azospirillum griseum TaxID=2496639 RepID=UPI001AECF2B8|nr:hypothetical protein [Azospirillum griseum]